MTDSTGQPPIPIFDGHNDTLLSLTATGRSFYERSETGHIDRVRAREGGLIGGFFAVFVPTPDPDRPRSVEVVEQMGAGLTNVPLTSDGGPSLAFAQQFAMSQIARLLRIEADQGATAGSNAPGHGELPDEPLAIVRSAADLADNIERGRFSAILHFEGAEMIDADLDALEVFYAAGLRSLGPVWSRSNIFAHGVPFAFPSSPDTGPGLTDLGKALVQGCNDLGILIDLSHLNEQGFWDVAGLSEAPLVATHSNAHAICPSSRNLTDRQLEAIAESDGIVGVNFNVPFLRPDGARQVDTPLDVMADHVDYLVERLGIDRVALGSDFDGALMPADLSDCSKLPNLIAVLRARGYDDAALRKIGYENWLRVLEATWGM